MDRDALTAVPEASATQPVSRAWRANAFRALRSRPHSPHLRQRPTPRRHPRTMNTALPLRAMSGCRRTAPVCSHTEIEAQALPDRRSRRVARSGVRALRACGPNAPQPEHSDGRRARDSDRAGRRSAGEDHGLTYRFHQVVGDQRSAGTSETTTHTPGSFARYGRVGRAHCCTRPPSEPDLHDFHASGSSKPLAG